MMYSDDAYKFNKDLIYIDSMDFNKEETIESAHSYIDGHRFDKKMLYSDDINGYWWNAEVKHGQMRKGED